MKTKTCL